MRSMPPTFWVMKNSFKQMEEWIEPQAGYSSL
jgi:hypothetical protein